MTNIRQCNGCTLCCELVPVEELHKRGGEKCQYQKFQKGCTVYQTARMPLSCGFWNCRWLSNDDTADVARPDRSRCVIDVMPDYVDACDDKTGERTRIFAVQIWCDPKHPDAWEELKPYIDRQGKKGLCALIRYGEREAITVFPPSLTGKDWIVIRDGKTEVTRDIIPYEVELVLQGKR